MRRILRFALKGFGGVLGVVVLLLVYKVLEEGLKELEQTIEQIEYDRAAKQVEYDRARK